MTTKTLKASNLNLTVGFDNGDSNTTVWCKFEGKEVFSNGRAFFIEGTLTTELTVGFKNVVETENTTMFSYEVGKDYGESLIDYFKSNIQSHKVVGLELSETMKVIQKHIEVYSR